jgi:MGT family glycosyltransferase
MRYLFVMWDGGGSVPPELGVARSLIARGHSVRVLSDPTVEEEVLAAGCTFTPWTTAPHRTTRDRSGDILRDYEAKSPMDMMATFMKKFLAGPTPRWVADTLQTLDAHPVDAVVVDFYVPAALIAAESRGLPTAIMMPNIWMLPTPGIPPIGPGFAKATGPLGRLRDAIVRKVTYRLFNKALPAINAARTGLGLPPVKNTFDQMMRADRLLVLSTPVFDFTSDAMPPHTRYVGAQLDDPSWAANWKSPWPENDTRPLVLVSLSSTFQDQVATLRRIVDALSTMPVRALVTLGLAVAPDEVPGSENVVVVPTAPHHSVLPHATAMITHCGHGTTLKALSHGVPLVCMPMGRDQNDTAVRVVHHGAGVQLKPTASVAAIRAAVANVLADPRYRQAASALAKGIRNGEQCVDAADELISIVDRSAPAPSRATELSAPLA